MFTPEARSILEELERRKEAKDDPCESCDGTGASNSSVNVPLACPHCLGQGVLLSEEEHRVLTEVAYTLPDILDAEIIE